jgi:cation diffusion facilitator CzcD-associated flavoprotein CzcO
MEGTELMRQCLRLALWRKHGVTYHHLMFSLWLCLVIHLPGEDANGHEKARFANENRIQWVEYMYAHPQCKQKWPHGSLHIAQFVRGTHSGFSGVWNR